MEGKLRSLVRCALSVVLLAGTLVGATANPVQAASSPCFPNPVADANRVSGDLSSTASGIEATLDSILRSNLAPGATRTVGLIFNGVPAQLIETRNADGTVAAEFDLLGAPGSGGTMVWTGTASRSVDAAGGVSTTDYSAAYDFTARHSVFSGLTATGLMHLSSSRTVDPSKPAPGVKKTKTITFTDFLPEEGDPRGPRNGSYNKLGEPGIGGAFTFNDSLALACPANPLGLVSDTTVADRWFKAQDASIHRRSDARASGGQIPTSDVFVALGCVVSAPTAMTFTLSKEEDGAGNTLAGKTGGTGGGGSSPCDPVFGPVPSLTSSATDYDFGLPVTFPGEW